MSARQIIRDKVRECVELAREKYGFSKRMDVIAVEFTTAGQAAGRASCKIRRSGGYDIFDLKLKFQLEAYELDPDEFLNRTVPHEVAHLVCYDDPALGKNHNAGWQRVCIGLGGSGSRTHQDVLSKTRYKTMYLYRMPSGKEFEVSKVRHRRMQIHNAVYTFRSGERMLKEHFVREISSAEHRAKHEQKVAAHAAKKGVEPKTASATSHKRPSRRKRMATTGTPSKLERCRMLYIPGSSRQSNIDAFVKSAGCTTAGAATYYAKIKKEMA